MIRSLKAIFRSTTVRLISAWLLAITFILIRQINCRLSFDDDKSWFWDRVRPYVPEVWPFPLPTGKPKFTDPEQTPRRDNNDAHKQIDFGGQWVLARMLTTGHGNSLYNPLIQREIISAAYPISNESPTQKTRDSDDLYDSFVALQAGDPPHEIRGPLYPPLLAFFLAPYAIDNDPQRAYFVHQYFLMGCTIFGALGISLITRRRIWWPVAICLILVFPGSRACFELGQNALVTLLILIWGWVFLTRDKPVIAGIIWGLLAYKPVWAMSYFFALILLRHYRMALVMVITGIVLGLATLPVVGVQSWLDWLKIGGRASEMYGIDAAWIPLSRDLFGLPRRFLTPFHLPQEERWTLAGFLAGWGLWVFVFQVSLQLYYWRSASALRVPFILLASWMLTYHFVYYDAAIAAFPFLLLIDAQRMVGKSGPTMTSGVRPLYFYFGLLFAFENVLYPLRIRSTVVAERFAELIPIPGGSAEYYPRLIITTDEWTAWPTIFLLAVWLWCAREMIRFGKPQ
ncbi:DUF2029 domain-containing protein [Telmatocola sphagniphila]|uniref:DUF2029 domain-containing protein n=1 Tax=Telmatocola sphagniphila TaxID=1123043 RepID=A0A8E6B7J2_9BACT|nr:glycosyltransferase family 87 protein [Telmatocola sphagniphila]QVL33342.1 DUF2029 domain-containing protein [Telmatocola sphagniphila]